MLQVEAVDLSVLELLRNLMQIKGLSGLRLVGGTALALQIGHRKSIDLDLFGILELDDYELITLLKECGNVTQLNRTSNIKSYLINTIKVDIVNYPYAWITASVKEDEIRLAGMEDIVAMKLAAITGRGTKKDFIDIFFLLNYFIFDEMIQLYNNKFTDGSEFMVLRSLGYFNDADQDPMPLMLEKIEWTEVKDRIKKEIQLYTESLT